MVDFATKFTAPEKTPRKLTGTMVALYLLGFFVVVGGVNAYMMTVALRTMPGIDGKGAYEASQQYNGEIARAHAQQARGWKADVVLGGSGSERDIVITLHDRDGAPVGGLAVQARLAHPADRKADLASKVMETSPGTYVATVSNVHEGVWDLLIEGKDKGLEVYKSRSRIKL